VKREQWWPIGLSAVLAATVLANVAVFLLAARNGGAEVAPDYYRRAVAWDSTVAEGARSRALHWTYDANLSAPGEGGVLSLSLRDSAGVPVTGARVRVESFPVARADQRLDTTLTEVGGGRYVVGLAVRRTEWHELDVTVRRGSDRFVQQLRCLSGTVCRAS
jgi:nitrogen fixation protein FixH